MTSGKKHESVLAWLVSKMSSCMILKSPMRDEAASLPLRHSFYIRHCAIQIRHEFEWSWSLGFRPTWLTYGPLESPGRLARYGPLWGQHYVFQFVFQWTVQTFQIPTFWKPCFLASLWKQWSGRFTSNRYLQFHRRLQRVIFGAAKWNLVYHFLSFLGFPFGFPSIFKHFQEFTSGVSHSLTGSLRLLFVPRESESRISREGSLGIALQAPPGRPTAQGIETVCIALSKLKILKFSLVPNLVWFFCF